MFMKKVNTKDIESILREAFPSANLDDSFMQLKMDDIADWDSLGNFNLLLAFEEFYGVRFSTDEMSELKSIAMIVDALERNH
jgi:acyl carrier protein